MIKTFAALILFFLIPSAQAAIHPRAGKSATLFVTSVLIADPGPSAKKYFPPMRIRDMQKLLGRKMTLKEKFVFKIVQWKIKKGTNTTRADKKSKKGTIALILGILALLFLVIPFVVILSIPAAILAIILGYDAKKKNPADKNARTGIILGWITIGIVVISVIILLALLANGWSWFA